MKKLKLIKNVDDFKTGEIVNFSDASAKDLIECGAAELLFKKDKEKKESKKIKLKHIKENEEKKEPFSFSGTLKITSYIHNVEMFHAQQPFFYDKSKIFWFWTNKYHKWEIVDEIDLMNGIDDSLGFDGDTVTSKVKQNYLEAFKRFGRKNHPKEAPIKWIQFKNKAFSLNSGGEYEVTPKYFFTNPIPWSIGETSETPVMDKLFEEWVGKKYVKTLYEIIAYCCYRSYPIHMCFCFIGSGRNGKTQFQKIISKFIGEDNLTSSSLDLIKNNRFETFKMYTKLVCLMGETNFGLFDNTDTFKRITGGDPISYEKKGKDGFTGYSYATILINSNSLPISKDTSEGFYRRWFIIDFPNNFPEGKDIIETIPDEEYNNLAKKVTRIISSLLEKGRFSEQGDIKERKKKYVEASNPLSLFVEECCYISEDQYVKSADLFVAYTKYLKHKKRRMISRREFSELLNEEGFIIEKKSKKINEGREDVEWINTYFVFGLNLKEFWDNWDLQDNILTQSPPREKTNIKQLLNVPKVPNQKPQDIVVEEKVIQDIVVEEKKYSKNDIKEFILKIIENKNGNLIAIQDISNKIKIYCGKGYEDVVETIITEGLKFGDWFESKPGWLRKL